MTMGTTYIWRCSKGVYRFAPEIYDALVRQHLTGNLPQECLYRMPEWAVYIETPGLSYERIPMEGFIAHLDYNMFSRSVDLQFAIFRKGIDMPKMIALPLGEGILLDTMDQVDQVDMMFAGHITNIRYVGSSDEYRQTFSSMLELLLYLCSNRICLQSSTHRSAGGYPAVSDHQKLPGCGMWVCVFPPRSGPTRRVKQSIPGLRQKGKVAAMPALALMCALPTGIPTGPGRVIVAFLIESQS